MNKLEKCKYITSRLCKAKSSQSVITKLMKLDDIKVDMMFRGLHPEQSAEFINLYLLSIENAIQEMEYSPKEHKNEPVRT